MKKLNFTLIIKIMGLIFLTVAGFLLFGYTMLADQFSAFFLQKSIALNLIRWILFTLLACFWPLIIKFSAKWWTCSVDVKNHLMALRWPVFCYFVLFELLIMQNTLAHCIDFLVN